MFRKTMIVIMLLLCFYLSGCQQETIPETQEAMASVETTISLVETSPPNTTEPITVPTEPTVEIPATEQTAPVESPSWYETSRLIYHAGGEVSGYTYSNSKEAVEKTLSDGNRLLEIDFLFTSDGHLVCLHEWQNLLGMTQPCTLEKFLTVHIFNKFTTITAMNIIDYMAQYPDMYLIVDTKEDSLAAVVTELLRLCDSDPSIADRFVIQLYDAGMKAGILELYPFGKDNFLFTAYKFGADRPDEIMKLCQQEEIRIVTVKYGAWNITTVQRFNDAGFLVFEHTVNDTIRTNNGLARGVYGFYTDSLQMGDLRIEE